MKAPAEEGFRRTLVFHHVVKEAEAFAAGLPDVTAQLHASDRELYPATVWADWLCGEHKPLHRRRVLAEFAEGIATDGTVVVKGYLGSVKVLGEGVDTKNCDSVYWADVRGSMPDLVQAVGRALRMQPGEGKVASLVVPILLGPGETPDNMLTSRAYGGLAKLLEALRAHDARIVETLAEQQAPSRYKPVSKDDSGKSGNGSEGVSAPAKALLKFSVPRDRPRSPHSSTCASSTRNTSTGGAGSRPRSSTPASTAPCVSRSPSASPPPKKPRRQDGRPRSPGSRSGSGPPTPAASTTAATWTKNASRSLRSSAWSGPTSTSHGRRD